MDARTRRAQPLTTASFSKGIAPSISTQPRPWGRSASGIDTGEVPTSVGEGAAGGGDAAADKALAAANAVSRVRGIRESKEAAPEARDGGAPTGRAAAAAAVAEVGNRGGQPAAEAAVTMVGSRRPAVTAAGASDVGGQAAEGAVAGVEVSSGDGRKGPALAGVATSSDEGRTATVAAVATEGEGTSMEGAAVGVFRYLTGEVTSSTGEWGW